LIVAAVGGAKRADADGADTIRTWLSDGTYCEYYFGGDMRCWTPDGDFIVYPML